ncbi:LytTR family DNA-binding domain-containing protein [Ureibacillus aquaedulcis]|uniref:LytTR family DNA-binding domain-containing protein n=1 Tax=Ureibacillus aquaedulcis TaxID=3058421 RepID=A0ABT8GTG5_9BACL|nr:LytTR family DNA-binding domain-containing protein [Ureibacillus sp. BA0131]MDN4494705.1 LytTR family DNA-binding domain-containing protein [Ureibacillus sp. BA0131]
MEMGIVRVLKERSKDIEQFKVILEDWIPKDASIVIAMEGSYVYCSASIAHVQHKIMEEVHRQSVAMQVLKNRVKTEILIDESIFGTPYYAIGYPVIIEQQEAALVIVLPSNYIPEKPEHYRFLTGKQEDDWTPIPIDQVTHIESLQKRNWFYANSEQYKTNVTLKELQLKLPEYFLRIHRSYIINIYFIKRISRDFASNFVVELKNGSLLPVSQSYINDLRKVLEF